jgi:hypothetical protein
MAGVLRDKNNHETTPAWAHVVCLLPSFLSIGLYLVLGAMIWRKKKWPWLFLGSMVMFILGSIQGESAVIASGIGEILFFPIIVWSFFHQTQQQTAKTFIPTSVAEIGF